MAKKYNCIKNGIPYFRKTKTIGYDKNGNAIRKEFYGDGEQDANKQIEEYMDKLEKGLIVDVEKLTVEQGMHQWLFDVLLLSKNKKSASFDKHECNYRNYIQGQKIGCIPVQNATSLPFQLYYNKLYKDGIDITDTKTLKVKHVNVSSNKIFDLNKTLRAFFSYCVKQRYTLNNPCILENIDIPGNADGEEDETDIDIKEIQAFNDDELKVITTAIKYEESKDNTFNVAVQLDLVTGLRLGELLGLKKKFITENIVKVRNTLKRVKVYDTPDSWHRETKLIKPKSQTSIRDVYFPQSLSLVLKSYLIEQEKKWKNNNLNFNDDSLIFTTDTCKPIDMTNFSRAWKRFLQRNKINYKKPHSMRDTYATTLIRRGAKIHDIKDLLGHSTIKITEKYYLFVFPEDKSKTANLIEDLVCIQN